MSKKNIIEFLFFTLIFLLNACGETKSESNQVKEKIIVKNEKASTENAHAEKAPKDKAESQAIILPKVFAQSLSEVVEKFSSYDDCVAKVEKRLPPDLGSELFRFANIADGICRFRQAVKQKNIEICNRVVSYTLKKGCKTMFALYNKQPDSCPTGYPVHKGRDAYCLALALRDPSLCRAAKSEKEEIRCKAILKNDPDFCASISYHKTRSECQSEVKRWKDFIVEKKNYALDHSYRPYLSLRLKMLTQGRGLPFLSLEALDADYGASVPSHGESAKMILSEYHRYGYRSLSGLDYRSPARQTKIDFSFIPPKKDGDKILFGRDASLKIKITGFGEFASASEGSIRVTRFERKRGGRIIGTFNVILSGAGDRIKVNGKFDTFVRDLVDPNKLYRRKKGGYYGSGYKGSRGYGAYGGQYKLGSKRGKGSVSGLGGLGLKGLRSGYGGQIGKRYATFLTSASLTHLRFRGKLGVQLTSIRMGSIWRSLGLKDGDIVLRVGNIQLKTQGDVIQLRQEIRDATSLKISYIRDRKMRQRKLSKADLNKIHREFRF